MMDNKQLWDSVLVEIELNISKANFNTWFKDTHIIKQEEGVIYLGVPNAFVREWLLNKYHSSILKLLRGLTAGIHAVDYVISREVGGKYCNKRTAAIRILHQQG